MRILDTSYTEVTLNDGTAGNYHLVKDMFETLVKLKATAPESYAGLVNHHLTGAALAGQAAQDMKYTSLLKHDGSLTQDTRDLLTLCLKRKGALARLFASKADAAGQYNLESPFRDASWGDPAMVHRARQRVIMTCIAIPSGYKNPLNQIRPKLVATPA